MRLGRIALRGTIGALFMGHGLQKLVGWFGGPGIKGLAGGFERMGLRPGKVHATAAGVAETAGGALLISGAATPLAGALLTGTMTTAIEKVHLQKGVWNTNGGYEYNLVLIAAVFALTAEEDGLGWALAELAAGVAGGLAASRLPMPAPAPDESSGRFEREEERVASGSTAG
jgi:putative oxidoreductase